MPSRPQASAERGDRSTAARAAHTAAATSGSAPLRSTCGGEGAAGTRCRCQT
jgi:hypothetical protein